MKNSPFINISHFCITQVYVCNETKFEIDLIFRYIEIFVYIMKISYSGASC